MSWSNIGPGKVQRDVGENETFLKLLGDSGHPLGHEHWAINCVTSFSPIGSLAKEDLRALFVKAWKCLRFDHPSIAARPVDDKHLEYAVPDKSTLDQWAEDTFQVVEKTSADDVISTLKPNPHMIMTYLPDSDEIVCHTAHWRTDGIGVLQLMNAFFDQAIKEPLQDPDTLAWGEETGRLAPAVEEAAKMPKTPTDPTKALGRKCVETFSSAAGAVGVPFGGDAATLPGGTRSSRLSLSPNATTAVMDRCKAKGISVTSAVHASVAAANHALAAPENRDKHYTSTVRFSLRPYLPQPYDGPAYASGLYTTGWMHAVPASASWDENARAYQEMYRKGLSEEYIAAHREYALGLGDLVRNLPPEQPDPPSDVDISSIGVAERLINRVKGNQQRGLEVTGISVGVEILTRQGVCFLWTFRDRLHLHLVYNESFHDEKDSAKFLAKVKEVLCEKLGVAQE